MREFGLALKACGGQARRGQETLRRDRRPETSRTDSRTWNAWWRWRPRIDLRVSREASMRIVEIPHDECKELLNRLSIGRLACSLDNQPYVVPVCFAYEA